jgi:uncharacterized membrane protein YphA (DoxX/SURF4 family)
MYKSKEWMADMVLRIGVAFAFLYPPINALSNPESWLGYFPPFTRGYLPDMTLLHAFGVIEVVIALWILSGKKIFWPSLAAAAMLLGIVVFNTNNFEVLFRDLSIAAAALALAISRCAWVRKPQADIPAA